MPFSTEAKRNHLLWLTLVMLLASALILPWIFLTPFSSKGEPREALTARSMIESGNWVLPQRLGDEIPTKPPLVHWLIAISALSLGELNEGAARLPSALASLVSIAVLFCFVYKRQGPIVAATSAIILLLSLEWFRASLTSRVDMTLATCLLISLLAAFRWEENKLHGFPFAFCLFLLLATLAKGPVALALTGTICFCYFLIRKHNLLTVVTRLTGAMLPVIALSLVWYVLAYQQGGAEFKRVVFDENFGRLIGKMGPSGKAPHSHSAFYLYGVLLLGLLPWSAIILASVIRQGSPLLVPFCSRLVRVRENCLPFKESAQSLKSGLSAFWSRQSTVSQFSLLSCGVFIGFYSLIGSKRSVYLLPIYPFLAILIAQHLTQLKLTKLKLIVNMGTTLALTICFIYLGAFLVLSGLVTPSALGLSGKNLNTTNIFLALIRDYLRTCSLFSSALLALPLILSQIALLSKLLKRSSTCQLSCAAASYVTLLLALSTTLVPLFASTFSAKAFVKELSPWRDDDVHWYLYGDQLYGMSFYLGHDLPTFPIDTFSGQTARVLMLNSRLDTFRRLTATRFKLKELTVSSFGVEKPLEKIILVEVNRLEF